MIICGECGFKIHRSQGTDHMGAWCRHRHRSDCLYPFQVEIKRLKADIKRLQVALRDEQRARIQDADRRELLDKAEESVRHRAIFAYLNAKIYPCHACGVMRSKSQGGAIFSFCDECWKKFFAGPHQGNPAKRSNTKCQNQLYNQCKSNYPPYRRRC